MRKLPPLVELRITRDELEEQLRINRWLILKIATSWRTRNRRIALDEYLSAVNSGFVLAAETFDKSRGFKFATYAKFWAENEVRLLLAFHDNRRGPERWGRPADPNRPTPRVWSFADIGSQEREYLGSVGEGPRNAWK